jgi:D-lactate dehydrogenase (cytochrome)
MSSPTITDFAEHLIDSLGRTKVLTGDAVTGYATDVYRCRALPLAVVRPETVEDLQAAVRTATSAGIAVYTRGGGASYTDGYLPARSDSILIDMTGLDRIVEINEADGYVTVEAGITWAALKSALDDRGLRTPFFGPFSGIAATVGGSISQHSISHGSGTYGISAQSVLSLEVVIAGGELIRTGSAARGAAPYARWYGPDLAGLFTGDCGVFGIKSRITLTLRRRGPAFECASYAFEDLPSLARGLRMAALEGVDDEHFALDAALAKGQIARAARISKFVTAKELATSAGSPFAALKQLVRTALAGSRRLGAAAYTAHFIMEGFDRRDARGKARRLDQLMRAHQGVPIANTVPAIVRSKPFTPLFNTLGPDGERWVPLHGYLPHSQVAEFHAAAAEFLRDRAPDMQRLGIWCGGMFMSMGTTSFLYELAFYWPGAQSAYHRLSLPAGYLASLPQRADDAETAQFVDRLKRDLVELYNRHQAVHFQLGKIYPYGSVLSPETLALVRAVKHAVDPDNLLNPGALELF